MKRFGVTQLRFLFPHLFKQVKAAEEGTMADESQKEILI